MTREARLPPSYYHVLNWLSQKERRAAGDLLKDAVDEYLAKRGLRATAILQELVPTLSDDDQGELLVELLHTLWAAQPKDLTAEEIADIERDIDETVQEVRAELAAERRAANA